MKLAAILNRLAVRPAVSKGVVTLNVNLGEGETQISDKTEHETYLDEHPAGAGRAGYVVWLELGSDSAYFCQHDGEWIDSDS